jgi:hypothetical protein
MPNGTGSLDDVGGDAGTRRYVPLAVTRGGKPARSTVVGDTHHCNAEGHPLAVTNPMYRAEAMQRANELNRRLGS